MLNKSESSSNIMDGIIKFNAMKIVLHEKDVEFLLICDDVELSFI